MHDLVAEPGHPPKFQKSCEIVESKSRCFVHNFSVKASTDNFIVNIEVNAENVFQEWGT
jgi:hypothetical protein